MFMWGRRESGLLLETWSVILGAGAHSNYTMRNHCHYVRRLDECQYSKLTFNATLTDFTMNTAFRDAQHK